jgi:hypothetical protein
MMPVLVNIINLWRDDLSPFIHDSAIYCPEGIDAGTVES